MNQRDIFEKFITADQLRKDALGLMKMRKYSLTLEEVIEELQEFYKAVLGRIALDSSNLNRYRRGWLLRAELAKKDSL